MDKEIMDNPGSKSSLTENNEPDNERVVDAVEADDALKNPNLDISKVRDRTFNKELSDLVEKITTHEDSGNNERAGEDSDNEIDENDIPEDKLLLKLHKLFYKTVNLTEIDKVNTEFNPFILYRESSSDDLDSLINKEMQNISLPEYAILVYDIKEKCYLCYSSNINGVEKSNIAVDTSEKLFSDIIENNVFVLDNMAIERDQYLRKRFTLKDGRQKNSRLLFISFKNIFNDFFNNIETDEISGIDTCILPLIMLRIDEKTRDRQKKEIYDTIRSKLAVYFFLLYKKILIDFQKTKTLDIDNTLNFLDYEFKKYNATKDAVCCVIKFKNYINIEFMYILEYLYIKLKQKLSTQCTISRIDKDKIILFTHYSKRKILDQILQDFNRTYGDIFQVKIFSGEELNRRNVGLFLLFHQQT